MRFPLFVKGAEGGCSLRLISIRELDGRQVAEYLRDAGQWALDAEILDGKIISLLWPEHKQLSKIELIPTDGKFWREDNGEYVDDITTKDIVNKYVDCSYSRNGSTGIKVNYKPDEESEEIPF